MESPQYIFAVSDDGSERIMWRYIHWNILWSNSSLRALEQGRKLIDLAVNVPGLTTLRHERFITREEARALLDAWIARAALEGI